MPPTDDEITARRQRPFNLKVMSIDDSVGLQQRLSETGFAPGPTDGIVGPLTKAAIRRFQQYCADYGDQGDAGIIGAGPVDGIFGPLTRKALYHYYYYPYGGGDAPPVPTPQGGGGGDAVPDSTGDPAIGPSANEKGGPTDDPGPDPAAGPVTSPPDGSPDSSPTPGGFPSS